MILVGSGPAADAKRRVLERAGASVVGESADAAIAIVAIEEEHEAQAAVARLRARDILVNATDRPELCDFTLPAIVERDPVLVAIGSGGASAGLAAALRQRLETLLPDSLGPLANALFAARAELRARFPDAGDRRRATAALLAEGGPLDPFFDHADPASAIAGVQAQESRIERIAISSPDAEELTLRSARLLGQADRLYHPADMAPAILDRARADAERIVGSAPALPPPGLSVELVWSLA